MNGKVTKLMRDKGFGFIRGVDGREYFVHRSQAAEYDNFREGDEVSFTPTDSPKGPRATEVARQ